MSHNITPNREGRHRVVLESVSPEIDGGAFPMKRVVGGTVRVESDVFTDGHDSVAAVVRYRPEAASDWTEIPMQPVDNNRWRGEFAVPETGRRHDRITAWAERLLTWVRDSSKRVVAGQDPGVDLLIGADLIEDAAVRAQRAGQKALIAWIRLLRELPERAARIPQWDDANLQTLMHRWSDRRFAFSRHREPEVAVDRERAKNVAWYEQLLRSTDDKPGRHGAPAHCEPRRTSVAEMTFDALCLSPIELGIPAEQPCQGL